MLSIIIPTLNEEKYLPRLLQSIFKCSKFPIEIMVVDGQSDDATQDVVKKFIEKTPQHITLQLIKSTVRNVSVQRNKGGAAAMYDTLLFLDADTVIPHMNTLGNLLKKFTTYHLVAATCRFQPYENDYRGKIFFDTLYIFHKAMQHHNPYALGACIMTRKDIFKKCKGFDATLTINEDANYCLRASQYGLFSVLPITIQISTRRFQKHGYLKMGLTYMHILFDRTLHGERKDEKIKYEFGNFN